MSGYTGGQMRGNPCSGILSLPFVAIGLALSGFGALKGAFGYGLFKALKVFRA
jgi:hypothetical protein